MKITEVRFKLSEPGGRSKLRAFCSITFDDAFVVRDLKVIDSPRGLFVAMPSRKQTERCPECEAKVEIQARFCHACGVRRDAERLTPDRLHADIAHPVHSDFRLALNTRVIEAYLAELELAERPGYTSMYQEPRTTTTD